MAIRINADTQAVYIHEPLGHNVPALDTAWTVAGLYRLEADVNLDTLIVALYGTTNAASWVGLYMNADGTSCRLEGYNGGSPVVSGNYTLEVGKDYRLAIDYNGTDTVRMLIDGVVVLSLAFTPSAGTLGERSLQWGGYGEISGYTSCTLARWRMWSAVLTEAEHRAEYRSLGPVRTAGLLHNWPMEPGSVRLDDTVSGQPDLAENPAVPVTDGTAFVYRPSIIGTPQFFGLGETATPGAQSITVPTYAQKVAVFLHQSDDAATPDASLTSLTSDFAGTFAIDQIGSSSVAMAVAVATADVTSTGAGKTWTPTLANTNIVAGSAAWVVFFQDVGDVWPTDTAVAQVTGDGTTPGTASGAGVVDGLAVAADTHLYATSGTYPPNESGWGSLATAETTGTYAYWASSRLRQRNITASGTESATTQGANGSCIALLTLPPATLAPAMQTAYPAADIGAGPWAPNTGTSLWGVLDESPASDIDWIATTANGTAEVSLSALDTPSAGAQTLTYRAAGSSAKALTVGLYRGATLHEQWTTDPLAAAVTEFVRTLTTPLTDVSDVRVRFTAQDAAAPPVTQVTFGAIGTGFSGTTSAGPTYPAGISASTSKLFCVVTGRSNTADTAPTIAIGGWVKVLDFEGGVGTWGADTGTRRVTVFQKSVVTGSETGAVTVSLAGTTNNTMRAVILRVEVPPGYGVDVAASTGADTSSGTAFAATGSTALDWAAGDLLMIAVAQATDTATQSAQSITASGITFGTRTNRASVAVTNGNDHRHIVDTVPVSAGSGSAAPTYSYTASAATSGAVGFLRLRAVPPAEFARVSSVALSVPAGDGTTAHSLAAAGSAQASATASLTVDAGGTAVELSAAGAAQVASSAALALAVTLAAQASAQASGAAGLATGKPLAATGAAQATGGAQLLHGVTLQAAGLAVASGGASLAHSVPLAATAAALATSGASLALAVTLGAQALGQAASAAGLSTGKPLAAAGAAQATGGAQLSTSGATELAAAGAAQATGGATLSLVVGLSAAGAAQAAAAASLATGKPLAAAGAAQAGASAGLQVGSATGLQAAGSAQATGGATLWLDVPLSAAALAQVQAGGSLTLTVPLSAAALAQAGGAAALASAVTLTAGGQAVAAAQAGLQVMGAMSQYSRGLRAAPEARSWRVSAGGRVFRHQPPSRAWRAS